MTQIIMSAEYKLEVHIIAGVRKECFECVSSAALQSRFASVSCSFETLAVSLGDSCFLSLVLG